MSESYIGYQVAGQVTEPAPKSPELILWQFIQNGEEVGRLWVKDGKLTFEGDADEAAKMFFDSCMKEILERSSPEQLAYWDNAIK